MIESFLPLSLNQLLLVAHVEFHVPKIQVTIYMPKYVFNTWDPHN